jgi:outer membrane immunogenic protein
VFRGAVMKKLATAIAAIALIGTPAYSWTGFYIGGNIGASFGRAKTDFNAAPVTVNTNALPVPIPGFAGSQQVDPAGVIGGGQLGYNWQFSPIWVAGIEADIQASGEKDSTNFTNPFSFTALIPVTGAALTNYEAKILWFGTVRGRIGYVWDRLMLYATGGLAYGKVKVDGTSTVSGAVDFVAHGFRKSSGSLAMLAAILRASSLLSSLAAEPRPGSTS